MDEQTVGVAVSINMNGLLGRGLFRVAAKKSTGPTELAYFLINGEVSTVLLYWVGVSRFKIVGAILNRPHSFIWKYFEPKDAIAYGVFPYEFAQPKI